MSEFEMTELCAKAMGVSLMGSNVPLWNPLHDDAQAMALVKKYGLRMIRTSGDLVEWSVSHGGPGPLGVGAMNADLNRAIVECVAKMQGVAR